MKTLNLKKDLTKYWKFRFFTLKRLPSLWFWGIKVVDLTSDSCQISIPYKWSSKNPFRSTYFAALAGAAELSTGLLLLQKVLDSGRNFSYLIVNIDMTFIKKATTPVVFTCMAGKEIEIKLNELVKTGETDKIALHSEGVTSEGVVVARAVLTWSIKERSKS